MKLISRKIVQKLNLCFAVIFLFNVQTSSVFAQPDGEKLFKSVCAACHTKTDKKLVGPGLKGVEDRWEDKELLYQWIKNPQSVLDAGDAYAKDLVSQYPPPIMTPQSVTDEEITAILAYIATEEVEVAATGGEVGNGVAAGEPEDDAGSFLLIIFCVLILMIALNSMLRNVKYSLFDLVGKKTGEAVPAEMSYLDSLKRWMAGNRTLVALILIVITVLIAKGGWDAALQIGVYEGYQPEQPIKFSHEWHAGEQQIDCNYCHSSARHSKTAGIPSANVCMNCHTFINSGPTTGEAEIAKIYAALDFDPATRTYGDNPKPIKWVKIHNLPDHVYFNHSQHVSVGKIECQKCHGPIEEMEVVEQHAPLTMGWCINCHRETEVKMEGNEYYDEFHSRLTDELKSKYLQDGKITVDEIGGLECGKCHY